MGTSMKFRINKGSDYSFDESREISDLKGLLELIDEFGNDLVLSKTDPRWETGYDYEVTVYDDYLE